ncbi:MAG: Clp protease ClpP [Candidatus Marinimicrobia bacterium]|nr:Clp protease ClpP [Candidatus Neomarinimicrobiota bacterium]
MRKFWEIRAAADEPGTGELLLYGPIGADGGIAWLFDDITPTQFKADLDALGDITELRVFINSDGGDVFAGQAIHSILKRHRAHVTVYIDGLAASIAAVVAMAGDTVIMPRNAMMMVHNPSMFGLGDAEEFRKLAETLDQVRESIVAAYESKTGMEHDELIDLLNAETWMTAEEAVGFGFADEVEAEKKIAASAVGHGHVMLNGRVFDLKRFEHAPEAEAFVDPDGDSPHDTYSNQATVAVDALAEYERRSLARIAVRAKSSKSLAAVDIARWERIRDAASGVLAKAAAPKQDEATDLEEGQKVLIEYEMLRARLNGVPV